MKSRLLPWAIGTVAVLWYVGFWLKTCDAVPGSWLFWCAPFYLSLVVVAGLRLYETWQRRRSRREARAASALDAAALAGLGLSLSERLEKPAPPRPSKSLVHTDPTCLFHYCPHPDSCRRRGRCLCPTQLLPRS